MIKVNKDSWHYRLLQVLGNSSPKTLCTYFWSVVFAPLAIVAAWLVITTVWLFGVDEGPYGEPKVMHRPAFWTMLTLVIVTAYLLIPYALHAGEDYLVLLILISIIIEIVCLWQVGATWKRHLDSCDRPVREGESFISLTWKTIKACKRKVCPLMEYVG